MLTAIILAGPNGAGKTTFANEFVGSVKETLAFLNADEIARDVEIAPGTRHVRAGRLMLQEMDALVSKRMSFMFETTLATLTYARKIRLWQAAGYTTILLYLRLPSSEHSVARVRRRVQAGGHDIPEPVIRRRFARSLRYLEDYKHIVDQWYVWDSQEGRFTFAERWDQSDGQDF